MKKARKWMSAFLSLMLAAGALTGCAAPAASSNAPSEAKEGSALKEASGDAQESAATGELSTLRVMGIDILSSNTGKDIHLSDWVNGDSKLWQKLTDDLAQRGVKLELDLIMDDQYPTVCQTALAAGLQCDFMNITPLDNKTRLSLVEQGRLLAVNDLWENHSDGTAKAFFTTGDGVDSVKKLSLEDGKAYWLPAITVGDYNGQSTGAPLAFHIRKDWLDTLKLPVPDTADAFYQTLVNFQEQDANGSGEKDEVIFAELKSFNTSIAQWFGLGTGLTYVDDADKTVKSPWYLTENVKAYISYMQKLVQAGLVDTSDQSAQKKAENKVAGMSNWATETWEEPAVQVKEGEPAPYFLPMMATAMEGVTPLTPLQRGYQVGSYGFAFTSECKDLKAAGALLDYLSTEEYAQLTEFGIEDYTFTQDEKGNKAKIKSGSDEILVMANLPALWSNNSVLPRRELNNRAEELVVITEAGREMGYPEKGFQEKADFVKQVYASGKGFSSDPESDFAIPTLEELEKTASIERDLKTYSEELLTKLILGQQSMDDWDKFMEDLKRLGLDEMITINQARYDRTK